MRSSARIVRTAWETWFIEKRRGISILLWPPLRNLRSSKWKRWLLRESSILNPSLRLRFMWTASWWRREFTMPKARLTREQIAERAALELPDGAYVNLGWGIPNLIAAYVPKDVVVYFHSENGILGMGPRAKAGEEDYDLVDAMKVPVTLVPGAAYFSQVDAHVMTRGGHLDICILGGLQVSERGDLANWRVPGAKGAGGIGGAMDISVGAEKLIVTMEHTAKDGQRKIVKTCSYPLTAVECVSTIITDLAVIDVTAEGLVLREVAPGFTPEEVQAQTEPKLLYRGKVPEMALRKN